MTAPDDPLARWPLRHYTLDPLGYVRPFPVARTRDISAWLRAWLATNRLAHDTVAGVEVSTICKGLVGHGVPPFETLIRRAPAGHALEDGSWEHATSQDARFVHAGLVMQLLPDPEGR